MDSDSIDPIAATRAGLTQIAEAWIAYARHKAKPYLEKLPEPFRQKLTERIAGAKAEVAAGSHAPAE